MGTAISRFWKRWLALLLFVVALATVCSQLGAWQLRRLDERRTNNATVVAHEQAPVLPAESVFDHPILNSEQWQRVRATGVYDADNQFQVRYRTNGGAPGQEVVTPLRLDSGLTILVARGFLPRTKGAALSDDLPPPPPGRVTVVGHVRRDEQGPAVAITPASGMVRLINSQAISAALGYPVAEGYIGLLTSDPPQVGGLAPIALPTLDDGPHFWYALQWFMFAGFALVGLVVLIRRDVLLANQSGTPAAAVLSPKAQPEE